MVAVDSDGVLVAPTNFFAANGIVGGGSGSGLAEAPTDATNLVLAWSTVEGSVPWYPSNNAALSFSDAPATGTYKKVAVTLGLTNGQTSVVFPFKGPDGSAIGVRPAPSTNTYVIVYDGTNSFIEGGWVVNDSQFSPDGSSIKKNARFTNSLNDTLTITSSNLAATVTRGLTATNGAVAGSGAQQISPAMLWAGHGYGTSGSASQPVEAGFYLLPVQGTTPTMQLRWIYRVNNGAWTDVGPYFDTGGGGGADFTIPGVAQITTLKMSGQWTYSNPSGIITLNVGSSTNNAAFSSAQGFIRLTNSLSSLNYDITGISSQASIQGRELILANISALTANTITLKHEDASSTASYRFKCPGGTDYVLGAGEYIRVMAIYDGVQYRWYLQAHQ